MRRHRRSAAHRRRGSLYVSVILVGALVSIIGLSALVVGRINGRSHDQLTDSTVARLNAQAALRLGMLQIENNPSWRFVHSTSDWMTDESLSGGTYSLTATDPSDNDITDAAADPVVLTGIGRKGEAIHRTQVTLAPLYRGYDCLQSAATAGDDVRFYNITYGASSDHVMSANDDAVSYNSYIDADIEAVDSISGYAYYGTTTEGVAAKTIPSSADVTSFYEDHGTWIDVDDLPSQYAQVARNGDFESGDTFWNALQATIAVDAVTANTGTQSMSVTNRTYHYSGVTQDLTHLIKSGKPHRIEFSAYSTELYQQFYVHIEVADSNGADDFIAGPFTPASINTWQNYSMTIQPYMSDPVTSVKLVINSTSYGSFYGDYEGYSGNSSTPPDFRIDGITIRQTGTRKNIDKVLLSPGSNPYGATDPNGVYVIDMEGQRLIVRNSRIHGTLVILNPGTNTEFGDNMPLSMSAAVPAYPTLIVAGNSFFINPKDASLVESSLQVNLNPPDAPYESVGSDSDMDDTFPTGFRGLIYGSHDLILKSVNIHGAMIAADDFHIYDSFSITYDSRFYRNPPPGFSGPEEIRLLLGSAKRLAD